MQTNDRPISELMKDIHTGKAQLPDFQRGWVWDDNRIRALIASITSNFPIGAAMFLEYGNENIRFKYRVIEGAPAKDAIPSELILDGQQRLTSMYSSLYSEKAVNTVTDKGQKIKRFYYIDIEKTISCDVDRLDAIVSVPDNRIVTSNFGRIEELNVSTREKEFENKLFPLNIILDYAKIQDWQNNYYAFYNYDASIIQEFTKFNTMLVIPTIQYKIPVILLGKETPKEAVCQVFENVNTGGVSLTVFELVTAIFAMDDFELRKDWEDRKEQYFNKDLLTVVDATDFLTACTLLSTYKKKGTVSCKKKDVLNLSLADYKKYKDSLTEGFLEAERILQEERIFSSRDLPYTTQFIPMAVLCALLIEEKKIAITSVKDKIKKWYWCGVFGEMYGGANETRYVNDVVGVMDWIADNNKIPKTVQEAYFIPSRLLSLQSRQSAAYKGIMALVLKNHCKDFISGREMDFTVYNAESIDIHHIFPKDYCEKNNYPKSKWNSVVNKTPISYSTNREIGGVAPSKYLAKIEDSGKVTSDVLDGYINSHWISIQYCRGDNFDKHIDRAFSAKTDKRPDFQRMIKDSAKKTFETVIVWKLDRFARNRYDSAHYKSMLKKNGVRVISATETISPGSEGILLESVLEGMAEYYSADLAEKVIRGHTENALKCKYNGGTLPIGFTTDKEQNYLIDPITAPLVVQSFQNYVNGMGMKQIADELNLLGVKNHRGGKIKIDNVNSMLKNRKYLGEYSYRDIVVPDGIPRIVSNELFEQVQQRMSKNKKAPSRHKAEDDYILTTKLFCGKCGSMMAGESGTSATTKIYHYYKCNNAKRHLGCDKKAVGKKWIEDIVIGEILLLLKDDTTLGKIADAVVAETKKESPAILAMNVELADTQLKLKNIMNAIENGIFTESTKSRLDELEKLKKKLIISLQAEQAKHPVLSKEQIIAWFHRLRTFDVKKKEGNHFFIFFFGKTHFSKVAVLFIAVPESGKQRFFISIEDDSQIWKSEFFDKEFVNFCIIFGSAPRIVREKITVSDNVIVSVHRVQINVSERIKPRGEKSVRVLIDLVTDAEIVIKRTVFIEQFV